MVHNSSIGQASVTLLSMPPAPELQSAAQGARNAGLQASRKARDVSGVNVDLNVNRAANSLADAIRNALSHMNVNLKVEVDTESKKVVVNVIDPETREVIKQFPSEGIINLSKKVAETPDTYEGYKSPETYENYKSKDVISLLGNSEVVS